MSADRSRYFLFREIDDFAVGDYVLTTSTGRQQSVDPAALTPYEITRDEAEAWLKAQLGDVLGELRTNTITAARDYFARRSPSARETPAELVDHAAAIETVAGWLQQISPRGADRLRTKATALRTQAAVAETTTGEPLESE